MEEMMLGKVFEYEGKIASLEKTVEYIKEMHEANAKGLKIIEGMITDIKVGIARGEKGTIVNVSSDTNIDNIGRDANISQP